MSVDGYTYYKDYCRAVLSLASEHVVETPSESMFESVIYQQWLAGRSVRDAARKVCRYYGRSTGF